MSRSSFFMRLTLTLLVAGVSLAACDEQSRVAPDAEVSIRGRVHAVDGGPLAERPVRLGLGVGTGEGAFAVLTLGLSCGGGKCRGDVFDTTTDGTGGFGFTLKGSDTQSNFGEALSMLVSATAAPARGQVSGAAVSARFRVQVEDVALPPLRLVDPKLALTAGDNVDVTWSAAMPAPYALTFETADTVPVWRTATAELRASVDPRVLEDTKGRVVVSGDAADRIEGSALAIHWRSPGLGFASAAGAPPSRGRGCRWVDANGRSAVEADCDLTDGGMSAAAVSPPVCPTEATTTAPCGAAVAAVVDLGREVPAELVVVRGCTGGCPVDVSTDGATFRAAGSVADEFGTVALPGERIRAVRVGVGNGFLREVSVWGPRPARSLQPLDGGDESRLRGPFTGEGGDGGLPGWLAAVAAVLAVGAIALVAYRLGRRRAPAA